MSVYELVQRLKPYADAKWHVRIENGVLVIVRVEEHEDIEVNA